MQRRIAGGGRPLRIGGYRIGHQLRRHGRSRYGDEPQDRRLLVNEAVQPAVGSTTESAPARKLAHVLCDVGEFESHGVGRGGVAVHVPDENRMPCRDRLEVRHGEVAAL